MEGEVGDLVDKVIGILKEKDRSSALGDNHENITYR